MSSIRMSMGEYVQEMDGYWMIDKEKVNVKVKGSQA